ncbi:MAG: DUF937 domain-containing protein [Thermoanaerobaculia bacterium]
MDLVHEIDPQTLSQISSELGTDEQTTRQALPAAMTALLGGLSQTARHPEGAQQLSTALEGHDGGLLDNLSGALLGGLGGSGGGGMDLGGILGQVLGGGARGESRPGMESQVSQATGLNQQQVGRLLMMLAPIVLAYLGRQHRERGGAAAGPGAITDILNGERRHVEENHPQQGGLLGSLLDRDGDGQILDDIAGMAGGFFGGRK